MRQAIYAARLRASKEGGTYYLDPQSVAGYRVSKRGPRRQDQMAKGPPGAALDARIGSGPDASFRVKHSRDDFELTEVWLTTVPLLVRIDGGLSALGVKVLAYLDLA